LFLPLGQIHLVVDGRHAEVEELLGTASLVVWVELEMVAQVKYLGHRIAFFDVLAALGRVFRNEGDAVFGRRLSLFSESPHPITS
jgi:hypothetical protein